MSLFNTSGHLYNGQTITQGYSGADREPRHPETGKLLRHCTALELEYAYKRFPNLPKVEPYDPERRLPWDDASRVGTEPANLQKKYARRNTPLLTDPAPVQHTPTKPVAKPEPASSLFRSSIHECAHTLVCFAHNVPVARISLIKNGDLLGHIK